jgi:hypothetical protein
LTHCAPATSETTYEPQATPMRTTAATGHRDHRDTYEPCGAQVTWWPKPVRARQLLECSLASSEWLLFRGLKSASFPNGDFKIDGTLRPMMVD